LSIQEAASEGVFLKQDPDYLPWIEEEHISPDPEGTLSDPSVWTSGMIF
jgi:hypothetical protein